jgi:cobalt/nickel transport protein
MSKLSNSQKQLDKQPDKQLDKQYNWLIAIVVLILAFFPIFFIKGEYQGADDRAEAAIKSSNANYHPWFEPILKPASGEIENFLFATQAGLGAGTIGYIIGLYKGRSQAQKPQSQQQPKSLDDRSPD